MSDLLVAPRSQASICSFAYFDGPTSFRGELVEP
jgi:hypothetical protein